jgi:hypothetical protein
MFAGLTSAQTPDATIPSTAGDPKLYGQYPLGYQAIVTRWLGTQLIDPTSAEIEWLGEPKPVEVKGRDGAMFYGYAVEFTVNSRNKFGMYTGKQARRAYIRNGEVASGGRVKR